MLERRPDIRQAEQQLIAANAQIGVARAQFFPTLPLTGSAGAESTAWRACFSARPGLFARRITQPIFTAGRLRANLKLAEAQQQQALLTLSADHSAGVPAGLGRADRVYEIRANFWSTRSLLTTAAQGAANLSELRYRGGAASYLEVLTNETNYFAAELNLARAGLNERLAVVANLQRAGRAGGSSEPGAVRQSL